MHHPEGTRGLWAKHSGGLTTAYRSQSGWAQLLSRQSVQSFVQNPPVPPGNLSSAPLPSWSRCRLYCSPGVQETRASHSTTSTFMTKAKGKTRRTPIRLNQNSKPRVIGNTHQLVEQCVAVLSAQECQRVLITRRAFRRVQGVEHRLDLLRRALSRQQRLAAEALAETSGTPFTRRELNQRQRG